jgi:DMSO/TMAO reductase YedYZ molybdopterin-dependent catalytic subunit
MDPNRRRFLAGTGALVLSALAPSYQQPQATKPENDEDLIVHPWDSPARILETRQDVLGQSWITPNSRFFVLSRKAVHIFRQERTRWSIRITGEVEHPLEVSLNDLLNSEAFRMIRFAAYIQCAGNGRKFFSPPAGSPPFGRGAIGNAVWTGVPLSDLLARVSVKSEVQYATFLEQGATFREPQSYIKSIPLSKARNLRTILALTMNNDPLPDEHGGPVRVLVPGWGGTYSVKWLSEIHLSREAWKGEQMETAYRVPVNPITPGSEMPPNQTRPFTAFAVNSMFTSPSDGARLPRGLVQVQGLAWSGEATVTDVEVSVDNGRNWSLARLGQETAQLAESVDHGKSWHSIGDEMAQLRYIWRHWRFVWDARPGDYRLRVRAKASDGNIQPLEQDNWNPDGYGWHAADGRSVRVV